MIDLLKVLPFAIAWSFLGAAIYVSVLYGVRSLIEALS